MNRLIIHKNLTHRTLFRVTGHPMYASHPWDIATNKQDIVAYFTQILPNVIVIGELEGMSVREVGEYVLALYKAGRMTPPGEVYALFRNDIETILELFGKNLTDYSKQIYRKQLQRCSIIKTPK